MLRSPPLRFFSPQAPYLLFSSLLFRTPTLFLSDPFFFRQTFPQLSIASRLRSGFSSGALSSFLRCPSPSTWAYTSASRFCSVSHPLRFVSAPSLLHSVSLRFVLPPLSLPNPLFPSSALRFPHSVPLRSVPPPLCFASSPFSLVATLCYTSSPFARRIRPSLPLLDSLPFCPSHTRPSPMLAAPLPP